MTVASEVGNGKDWKNFEARARKSVTAMNGLLAEIWMLKVLPGTAQEEKKGAKKKASIFVENIYIIMN